MQRYWQLIYNETFADEGIVLCKRVNSSAYLMEPVTMWVVSGVYII